MSSNGENETGKKNIFFDVYITKLARHEVGDSIYSIVINLRVARIYL